MVQELLDGWDAIAARLSQLAGVPVSKHQAWRYAHRAEDPLPCNRVGRLARARIVADPVEVARWARREWNPRVHQTGQHGVK